VVPLIDGNVFLKIARLLPSPEHNLIMKSWMIESDLPLPDPP
jgi:hypothetical protein